MSSPSVSHSLATAPFGAFQWAAFLCMSVAFGADGMEVMLLAFIGPVLECEWKISPEEESLLTSGVVVGWLLGSLALGWLSDVYGRRPATLASFSVSAVFGVL